VFEADSPFQRFERLTPTTARGPGVIDMKGGDVIIVSALKALARVALLDRLSVTVVMTGDEEDPGEPLDLARKRSAMRLRARRSRWGSKMALEIRASRSSLDAASRAGR
jgi:acetylornithine deacetylase/succinyl-diaminopimelate desuccinylase-like protein